jgi:hypothetical protein
MKGILTETKFRETDHELRQLSARKCEAVRFPFLGGPTRFTTVSNPRFPAKKTCKKLTECEWNLQVVNDEL